MCIWTNRLDQAGLGSVVVVVGGSENTFELKIFRNFHTGPVLTVV